MTTHRTVCRTHAQLMLVARALIQIKELPITVAWKEGIHRSTDQNALAWKWAEEISIQKGDMTAQEVHSHNKLHHGVAIRKEDEDFRAVYDRVIRPLSYEDKLAIMAPPIDFPVTRDMGIRQMTRFLDAVRAEWVAQGVVLTLPVAA